MPLPAVLGRDQQTILAGVDRGHLKTRNKLRVPHQTGQQHVRPDDAAKRVDNRAAALVNTGGQIFRAGGAKQINRPGLAAEHVMACGHPFRRVKSEDTLGHGRARQVGQPRRKGQAGGGQTAHRIVINRQPRALQRHAIAGRPFPDPGSGLEQHDLCPATAQTRGRGRAGNAAANHRNAGWRHRLVVPISASPAPDHLPLAPVARNPLDGESGRLEAAAHIACRRETCKRATGPCQPADMKHVFGCPHGRVAGRREPVEEPAIRPEIQRRQHIADFAVMQMQRQPPTTQLDKMIPRPAGRQGRTKSRRLCRNGGEGRMRLFHLFSCQGEPFERDIIEAQFRMTVHFRHHSKKVEAGAEPCFRDGQMA